MGSTMGLTKKAENTAMRGQRASQGGETLARPEEQKAELELAPVEALSAEKMQPFLEQRKAEQKNIGNMAGN